MTISFRKFIDDPSGGITAFGLFMLVAIFAVGGLAIDVTNAIRERTYLQIAADAAAHAALVTRDTGTVDEARIAALQVAERIMPSSKFGSTIQAEDIDFGTYDYSDPTSPKFKVNEASKKAVLVNTQRVAERGNSVGTFFLRLVGYDGWNLTRQSVFETYKPGCLREGYVADAPIDISSGNTFEAGFCIHSNEYVKLSSDNTFEDGTVVSMPDIGDIEIPTSGWDSNEGLIGALRDASYTLRILDRIDDIYDGVTDPDSIYYRDYLTSTVPLTITASKKLDDQWEEGRVHVATCANEHQLLETGAEATLKSGVLFTNCVVMFPNAAVLEDVAIVSTNTLASSVMASASLRMGRDDDCEPGGGAQIITLGGVKIAAAVSFYNAQIIAGGDIEITANIEGQNGVSLISAGTISGTSNGEVGFCNGKGMENNFEAWYFRMRA